MAEFTKACVVFLYLQIICTIYHASTTNAIFVEMNIEGRGMRTGDVIFVEGVLSNRSYISVYLRSSRSACRLSNNRPRFLQRFQTCNPIRVTINPIQSTVAFHHALKTNSRSVRAIRNGPIKSPSYRPSKNYTIKITVGETNYTIKVNNHSVILPDLTGKRYVTHFIIVGRYVTQYSLKNKHGNPLSRCGLRPGFNAGRLRVIGGTHSRAAEVPWQASLRFKQPLDYLPFRHVCGATLIDSCWVLTTVHCLKVTRIFPQYYIVRVGDYYKGEERRFSQFEDTQDFDIEEIIIHPQYDYRQLTNDVALIKLRSNSSDGTCARYSNFVQPICLPSPSDDFPESSTCLISGWGATNRRRVAPFPHHLSVGNVTIQNFKQCKFKYERSGKYPLASHTVCASNPGVDTCNGDSGGPMSCSHSANGPFIMWGMTSWGRACNHPTLPGVYMRISSFMDWIERMMSRHG